MSLYWGVTSRSMPMLKNSDDIFKEFVEGVTAGRLARRGDLLVMVSKSPLIGISPNDLIKIQQL